MMLSSSDFQKPEYWRGLYFRLQKSKDLAEISRIINEVSCLEILDASADILRLTFLSEFDAPEKHIRLAGLRAANSTDLSADALSAFASLYCIRALRLQDRESFLEATHNAQLPKIISQLNKLALEEIQGKMKVRIPEKLERITIVATYFGNTFHTPSVLAVDYASIFSKLGMAVNIITCQELVPTNMLDFHGAGRQVSLPAVDSSGWSKILPKGVTVSWSKEGSNMLSRWRSALDRILRFDPDLILCVGPFSPFASALYHFRPVIALPTNTVSFLGCADIWLRGSDHTLSDTQITWNDQFPLPLSHSHPFRIPKKDNGKSLTREQLGIDSNDVVLVTVGFRLAKEIEGDWANQMLDILSQREQLIWVLIGSETPRSLVNAPSGKILNLGPRNDVSSILQLCDVYVNPPRMGGGFSVLEAMSSGLATVAFCNTDGGEKIGPYAAQDTAMYFSQLLEFIKNPEQRISAGKQLQQRFAQYYDIDSSGPSLMNACKAAMMNARKRLKDSF